MSVTDFGTIVSFPVNLFNRLIWWWSQIVIGGFTFWQWILSFMLVGIGIAVFRLIIGSVPSIGLSSAVGRVSHRRDRDKGDN